MSIVYVPRLIESATRAEALPVGSLAYIDVIGGPARYSAVKTPSGDWYIGGREHRGSSEMTRWTALVPIEAEEETREHPHRVEERVGHVYRQPIQQVRYKTRWEAA